MTYRKINKIGFASRPLRPGQPMVGGVLDDTNFMARPDLKLADLKLADLDLSMSPAQGSKYMRKLMTEPTLLKGMPKPTVLKGWAKIKLRLYWARRNIGFWIAGHRPAEYEY